MCAIVGERRAAAANGAANGCGYAVRIYCPGSTAARRSVVATPNYSYEKRQRELAKKRKQEEKRQKKLNPQPDAEPGAPEPDGRPAPTGDLPATPDPKP
jgi:hypothetical protein